MSRRPNVVLVFGDQWRQQATGYAGDPNVQTPHLDRLDQTSLSLELSDEAPLGAVLQVGPRLKLLKQLDSKMPKSRLTPDSHQSVLDS